jgi:hypothetical protein
MKRLKQKFPAIFDLKSNLQAIGSILIGIALGQLLLKAPADRIFAVIGFVGLIILQVLLFIARNGTLKNTEPTGHRKPFEDGFMAGGDNAFFRSEVSPDVKASLESLNFAKPSTAPRP